MNKIMNKIKLGVCYYPEHWDPSLWQQDIKMMQELGISYIRLAEFAWGKMQPSPDEYDFAWLDEVIGLANDSGIGTVLCTPTATPPAWLIKKHPEILPVGEDGRTRSFGSRRHYSFNSPIYLEYSRAITEKMAKRYGNQSAVVAWQTDNEFACHDTARSYGDVDKDCFHSYLAKKYGDISKLNNAWGNSFWDQNYGNFDEIPLPNNTVAEANPAHLLDFYRFCSQSIVAYNLAQTDILRKHCPDQPITHNMMGFTNDFDHFAMGQDLDFASWDNYPLGYLEEMYQDWSGGDDKKKYYDIGHPDISAFYHDLYRGIGKGKLWIMEQQPGAVNWAGNNPAPVAGAVKFWTWQAFAHGAEVVSYFRWRQVPYAQEQMHSAILSPDSQPATAHNEIVEVKKEMSNLPQLTLKPAEVALLYDYESCWYNEILPQGSGIVYPQWAFRFYEALRGYGINLDIVHINADLSKYKLVIVPALINISKEVINRIQKECADTQFLWGPSSGSKNADFQIPQTLAPGNLQQVLPIKIKHVSSLNSSVVLTGDGVFGKWQGESWREYIETDISAAAQDAQGGVFYTNDNHHYLGVLLNKESLRSLTGYLLKQAEVDGVNWKLAAGMRVCSTEQGDFIFDFAAKEYKLPI